MCSRYTITSPIDALRRLFGFDQSLPNLEPNYNVAPTDAVPFVRLDKQKPHLDFGRWGLVPSWSKAMPKTPLINARGETLDERPSFRAAFRRRRCLVPMDGFYEWQARAKGPKQPYYIIKDGGGPFAVAGIYEYWLSPEGDDLLSMAIVTTEANEHMRPLHARVPVAVMPADFDAWLECDETDIRAATALIHPPSDDFWTAYPVSRKVSRVGTTGADLIEPIAEDAQQSLGF